MKTVKNLSKDSLLPDQDLNWVHCRQFRSLHASL